MSREKQIEEMAKELCGMNIACKDCRLDKLCLARNSADILYNAGYRKQSEVAREIFAEIEKLHLHITNEFDLRRYNELKKEIHGG